MPVDDLQLPRERTRTAHEYVKSALREAIMRGTLARGEHLVQTELARVLKVSTTPVREALRDLATEGLITLDPHRGAIVRDLRVEEVKEIYELRLVLEPILVRKAVPVASDQDLELARGLLNGMRAAEDVATWVDLNRQFHAALVDGVPGATWLRSILENLRNSATPFIALSIGLREGQMSQADLEHRDLLDAFARRDVETAVELTEAHLLSTMTVIESASREHATVTG